MQIILLQRIENLGQMGDVVTVKPGYARNFLLPKKKALRATKENISYFEGQRKEFEAENLKTRKEAENISQKMKDIKLKMIRQASDKGHLYGSVSARDIADNLKEIGFSLDYHQVEIPKPIKEIGISDVRVKLHPEVIIKLQVNVAQSEDEAKAQEEALNKKNKPTTSSKAKKEDKKEAKDTGKKEKASASSEKKSKENTKQKESKEE
jgi:large subunit ribosomal protein L9